MLHQKERNRPRRSNCLNALRFNGIGQTSKSRLLLQMRLAVICCRLLSVPTSFLDGGQGRHSMRHEELVLYTFQPPEPYISNVLYIAQILINSLNLTFCIVITPEFQFLWKRG